MLLIGPSVLILGLVATSVAENETSTINSVEAFHNQSFNGNVSNTATPSTTTNITSTSTSSTITSGVSTATIIMIPSTTEQKRDESTEDGGASQSPTAPPKVTGPKKPIPKHTTKDNSVEPTPEKKSDTGDNTGIIILVVIILVAFGFGVACFFARKRGRRYSVDLNSRPDDANIPLSTMEPELHVDTVSHNGMRTFESVDATTKEPQEPEAKPEAQEEQKAEADKSVADPNAESAAPAPSPDSSEEKPKEDVVEQSPPAPVEEKTDDEGTVSNKTSVESLKETNENNSNNADVSQKRDLLSDLFWDVPLNCPV